MLKFSKYKTRLTRLFFRRPSTSIFSCESPRHPYPRVRSGVKDPLLALFTVCVSVGDCAKGDPYPPDRERGCLCQRRQSSWLGGRGQQVGPGQSQRRTFLLVAV